MFLNRFFQHRRSTSIVVSEWGTNGTLTCSSFLNPTRIKNRIRPPKEERYYSNKRIYLDNSGLRMCYKMQNKTHKYKNNTQHDQNQLA